MKDREPDVVRDEKSDRDIYSHPAFGFIRVTRVSGGNPNLFMSNVPHENRVSITLGSAKMERAFHHDKHYAERDLLTLEMSSVQFADLMAGLGMHSGVPCTIRRAPEGFIGGRPATVPGINMEGTTKRFKDEVAQEFRDLADQLNRVKEDVRSTLNEAKVSKARQDVILAPIGNIARKLSENLPFMADMFQEGIEGLVQEAKAVVEAFASEHNVLTGTAQNLLEAPDAED